MLTLSAHSRIFIHSSPTDMRKSFDGLTAIVNNRLSLEVTSGAFFVFLNKPMTAMKVIYWDGDGLAIWYKRLSKGCFSRKNIDAPPSMSRKEFFMLLEGITPKRQSRRYTM